MLTNGKKAAIVINFKKLNGKEASELMTKLNAITEESQKYNIILAMQARDAVEVPPHCKFRIFIQDIFSARDDCFLHFFQDRSQLCPNISGVILNHPEKKLTCPVLDRSIEKARELGLSTLLCATTIEEAVGLKGYSPRYIGIEDESLIGKDVSFTDHNPEIVKMARSRIEQDILIGAGVRTTRDLKQVIDTGGSGVLISSLILKSQDPLKSLLNFLN